MHLPSAYQRMCMCMGHAGTMRAMRVPCTRTESSFSAAYRPRPPSAGTLPPMLQAAEVALARALHELCTSAAHAPHMRRTSAAHARYACAAHVLHTCCACAAHALHMRCIYILQLLNRELPPRGGGKGGPPGGPGGPGGSVLQLLLVTTPALRSLAESMLRSHPNLPKAQISAVA